MEQRLSEMIVSEMNRRDAETFSMYGDTSPVVGGVVLGNSFEEILRSLSADYLARAFNNLLPFLEELKVEVNDLGWGWMHPGHTALIDTPNRWFPSDYLGWTSPMLTPPGPPYDPREVELDARLRELSPSLRLTFTYRGGCWKIPPRDFHLGLRFIEWSCTEEVSDWYPNWVLQTDKQVSIWLPDSARPSYDDLDVWKRIALALRQNNQHQLDVILDAAQNTYSPDGYRLIYRGYRNCIERGCFPSELVWPNLPTYP